MPETTEQDSVGRRLKQLTSLFSPVSFQRRGLLSEAMQQAVFQLQLLHQFDIIQVESSQMAGFQFDPTARLLVDEHNIEYELLLRMYQTETSPIRKLFSGLEYQKFRREEQQTWRHADGCIMTSGREAEIVRQLAPDQHITVAPNGVDIDYFVPSAKPVNPNSIVLTGLMRYRPNIDAALYFVQEVFPFVLKERPDSVFTIVGAGPPDEVKQLARENVIVTDTVPDVRPYVESAAVIAVPLRMGSGTRLKVLEALSMCKPMVSTAVGCEGIDVQHDKHLLIADDAESFANAVVELMSDAALCHRLGKAGRELAVEQYSWVSIVEQLEKFYSDSLSRTKRSLTGSNATG